MLIRIHDDERNVGQIRRHRPAMADGTAIFPEHFTVIIRDHHQRMIQQSVAFQFIQDGGDDPVQIKEFVLIFGDKTVLVGGCKFAKLSRDAIVRIMRRGGNIREEEFLASGGVML